MMLATVLQTLQDLKNYPQWVCFTSEKMPINPRNGYGADCNDPETWASYEDARKAWQIHNHAGIGFEFVKDQCIVGVDLDKCIDEQGTISDFALHVIRLLNSYTEYSPSGKGLHIWLRGNIDSNIGPNTALKDADGNVLDIGKIEMYDCQRYFTITGKHLSGTPETFEDRSEEVQQLHTEITEQRRQTKQNQQKKTHIPETPRQILSFGDTPYGLKALSNECQELASTSEGGRNHKLNETAFRLGQLVGGNELSRDTVERELHAAAAQTGLNEREIEKTMLSGLNAGIQQPRSHPIEPPPPDHPLAPDIQSSGHFNLTDLGNAERFKARYHDCVRWCQTWNTWMIFNGKCWEADRSGRVDQFAKVVVRNIYKEATAEPDELERKRIAKHAAASESNRSVRAMLDRAKSELPVTPDEFNVHLYLLNCDNGTLDLRHGELHPHSPGDMLTRCIKIKYNPLATCIQWKNFIDSIFANDTNLITFMQQALGMSLCGDISEQCLFICHGTGSNGKTTMLETVRIIMGSYALAANVETFQMRKNDGAKYDIAELYGARFVTASENTQGSRLNEAFIKKATGKEPLRAARKYESEFEFMPEFSIWFAVNHKPVVKDTSKGMWRRVHFIPFTVTIEGNQVDKHLGEKLLEEAEGILTWLVQGCMQWYKQGRLEPPKAVQEATQAYREEMDVIAGFIEDQCEQKGEVGATVLYKAYQAWCDVNGERWEKQKSFGAQLTERGYRKERTRDGMIYRGLSLHFVNDVYDVYDKSENFSRRENTSKNSQFNGSHHTHHSQKADENEELPDVQEDESPSQTAIPNTKKEHLKSLYQRTLEHLKKLERKGINKAFWSASSKSGFDGKNDYIEIGIYKKQLRACVDSGDQTRIDAIVEMMERLLGRNEE